MRFSSEDVLTEMRREAVEAAFGAHVRGQIDFAQDMPLRVALSLKPLASIHLAQIESSPLSLMTPADDDGLLYVSFTRAGGGVIDARGEPRRVRAGEFNMMLRNRRCMTIVEEASSILSLAVPRAMVEPRLTGLDRLRSPLATPGSARLLGDYAAALAACSDLEPNAHAIVAGHLVDLIVLALGAKPDDAHAAREGGVRAARRRAVKADIVAHMTDPSMNIDWVARRHGVSPATIRALFYDEGTSFSDFLRGVRLDHVRTLLRSPYLDHETIASLALMAGFNDIAWFNQAFRRKFGMTPSEMRRECRARENPLSVKERPKDPAAF
ncbi:MAG TPA: AraC family transcriptional regulator [Sphingomonas sp.]|nr:AraC family transcriptional regulator [Sphingomonas sp.]